MTLMVFCTPNPIAGEYVCPVCGYGKGRGHQRPFTKQCIAKPGSRKRKFPSLAAQAWNLTKSLASFATDGCKTVDKTEYQRRLAICDGCDMRAGNRCSSCGCNLSAKAKGRAFRCPLSKWSSPLLPLSSSPRLPRVAFWSPGLNMGGAERWIVDLMRHLDGERVDVLGLCVGRRDNDLGLQAKAADSNCVEFDRTRCRAMFDLADVVVFWGSIPPGNPKHAVFCSHGGGDWATLLAGRIHDQGVKLVAVSTWAARAFPDGAHVDVIHNGVDLSRLKPVAGREATRARLGILPYEIAVGFVGRVAILKNPTAVATAAMHAGRPARPVYVGPVDPGDQETLSRYCPSAIFVPPTEDVGDLYASLDCFVLASPSEGFSLARIEAWAAGVPTISTPVGAVPEVEAEHGQLTIRVPVDPSAEELGAAVRLAISEENRPVVDRARRVAREHFSAEAMGRRWTKYILGLVR